MSKYELVSGWIWRCDNSEVRTDDPAGAIEELEAQLAEKDAIIDNLQQALNCASEDFVHSERISEVRNKTAEIWELNYELACRRADDAEQRAKEAENAVKRLEEELASESCWAESYFRSRESWREKAEQALKQAEEYEEWYMRADSAFNMAKWRADKAEADVELWRKRALFAGKKYLESEAAWQRATAKLNWVASAIMNDSTPDELYGFAVVELFGETSTEEGQTS